MHRDELVGLSGRLLQRPKMSIFERFPIERPALILERIILERIYVSTKTHF
jgi:hypothetical protein